MSGLRSLVRYEVAIYALDRVCDAMHSGIIGAAVRKACIEERDRLRDLAGAEHTELSAVLRAGRGQP